MHMGGWVDDVKRWRDTGERYSRRMGLGNVPHRTLHLLPLIPAQKERPRQRNMQFPTLSAVPRIAHIVQTTPKRTRIMHRHDAAGTARPRVQVPPSFRNAHCALDDASERGPAQRDRHVDVGGPLALDVWRCARAALVLGWVVGWDGGGEVRRERGELALGLLLCASWRWWWWGRRRRFWSFLGWWWCFVFAFGGRGFAV